MEEFYDLRALYQQEDGAGNRIRKHVALRPGNQTVQTNAEIIWQREEIRELKKQAENLARQLDEVHKAVDWFIKEISRLSN